MQTNSQSSSKFVTGAGNVLIFLVGFLLIGSSITKFVGIPKVVGPLKAMGFDGAKLTLIAVLEIMSAVLFLIPRTRVIGLLLASAYLGGAIATHLQHGQLPAPPAFVLALAWIGIWLRYSGFLASFSTSASATQVLVTQQRESLAGSR
jgi:hypothetical protein